VRELTRRGGNGGRLKDTFDMVAMPGPGTHSRKAVAGKRLAQAIALGVGDSGVRENLDQPIVIRAWKRHESGLGNDRVDAEIADCRVQPCGLKTGDEVEASMSHTGWVRSEIAQDLPECAGVRIDVLVVGNDLKRPDRVLGHAPPLRGVTIRAGSPDSRGTQPQGR
jgi:hypothetical protein